MEFAVYNTTFAGMNGERPFKKIRKPKDLYKLPTDTQYAGPIKIDKVRATADVSFMKEHFKWQKDLNKKK